MYNIAPKLQKCWTHKYCLQYYIKILRHPNFFHSEPSVLSKDAPAKFHLSATFILSFVINSVAPTCSSTFYAYLITKIRNHNLKSILTEFIKICLHFRSQRVQMFHGKFLISQAGVKNLQFFFISQLGAMQFKKIFSFKSF